MNKKETVLDSLFRAKKELEDSKIKEEQHALGYINEAIKWIQVITGDYNEYKDNEHQIFINEESYCNIVVEKNGELYFKGSGYELLDILIREKHRLLGKYVRIKKDSFYNIYKIIETFPFEYGIKGRHICGAEAPKPVLCKLEGVNTGRVLDELYYEDELIYENN